MAINDTITQPGDFLSIILDLNPLPWHSCAQRDDADEHLTLQHALESVLLFCNAHLSLRNENELVVYGAGAGQSRLFFSSLDRTDVAAEAESADGTRFHQFRLVDDRIAEAAKDMLVQAQTTPDRPPDLVGGLAKSLCHFNRINRDEDHRPVLSRILILSVSADASAQYISIMNCIFSAQKASVPIDVCKIYGEDAVFLQQAAFLTSGLYYHIERRSGLLQYLMTAFLPGRTARKLLNLPHQDQVDLRAACFCHRRIVDIGFVCSVCLSIFCTPVPQCTTCKTSFALGSLKRLANTRGSLKR